MFAGRVQLEDGAELRRCAIKRLRAATGLHPERLLQEALTMIECQDVNQPLLLVVALGGGHYDLVSSSAAQRTRTASGVSLQACDRF